MTTIYAVTSGEYSDFGVDALFSTKEKAAAYRDWQKKFQGRYNNINEDILEYNLDPFETEMRRGLEPYVIDMLRDGKTTRAEKWEGRYTQKSSLDLVTWSNRNGGKPLLHGIVWAKDVTHAVKLANEKRTKLIALGEWK